MTSQFISCSATECPMNKDRACLAPFLMLDKDGKCLILENGPYDDKSVTDTYVEIRDCQCKKCNYWKKNEIESTGIIEIGNCGLNASLSFNKNGICNDFSKQIVEPGFSANV